MGHYDLDYEYEDDKKRLSGAAFKEKWQTTAQTKFSKPIVEKKMSDNQSDNSIEWTPWEDYKVNKSRVDDGFWGDSYKVNDITEMRITVRKPGGSMIVVDVDNEPSYSFYLSTEQTNSLLIQLLNKKS